MTLPAKKGSSHPSNQSMNRYSGISGEIEEYLEDPKSQKYSGEVIGRGLRSLPALRDFLRQDLPIERAERLEALLKAILKATMANPVSGRDAAPTPSSPQPPWKATVGAAARAVPGASSVAPMHAAASTGAYRCPRIR